MLYNAQQRPGKVCHTLYFRNCVVIINNVGPISGNEYILVTFLMSENEKWHIEAALRSGEFYISLQFAAES